MTVHPESIVSGGGDSSEAASSHPLDCGNRCGKSRAPANLFTTTAIIAPTRATYSKDRLVLRISGMLELVFAFVEICALGASRGPQPANSLAPIAPRPTPASTKPPSRRRKIVYTDCFSSYDAVEFSDCHHVRIKL